jgi:hypothetical protein
MKSPFHDNDPLWKMRHAIAGVAIALLLSVFAAALGGRVLGDALGDSYGLRAGIYGGLLLYVVVGAGVLFAKVARHETRPLSPGRVVTWLASLWLWPLLLMAAGKKTQPPPDQAR